MHALGAVAGQAARRNGMNHKRCASGRFRFVAWLLVALWATAPVAPARADDVMHVALVDLSVEEAATREIAFDVARALRAARQVRVAELDSALNLGGEDIQRESAKSADQAVAAALKKLDAKAYDDAVEELDNAIGNYLIAYAILADTTIVPKTMALLATAQLLSGDQKGADKNFERAAQCDQKAALQIDVTRYSPKAQAAFTKARSAVAARDTVDFEIRTEPPNARVYVNGRYMGLTPTFASSTKGEQLISISKQGYARKARKLIVDKADQVVDERLEPARRAAALDAMRPGLEAVAGGATRPDVLAEAEGLLGTSHVVLLRATGTRAKMRVSLALANLRSRQVINQIARDIAWENRDKATREQIDRLVDEVLKPRVIVAPTGPTVVEAKPIYQRWWFWTVIGAVAAGSAAAWYFAPETAQPTPAFAKGTGGVLIQF